MEGLSVIPNFLTADEETALLAYIDEHPWSSSLKRRTQHYGYEYDYASRTTAARKAEEFPEWFHEILADKVKAYFGRVPDQMIINEYQPGQGISAHTDAKVFGPVIVSISLGSDCIMTFTKDAETREVLLPRRSILVMSGDVRTKWKHEIGQRKTDMIDGKRVKRDRRVSITLRTVF